MSPKKPVARSPAIPRPRDAWLPSFSPFVGTIPPHLTELRITPVKGCLKSQSHLDKSKPLVMFIRTRLQEAPPVNKSNELVLNPN